MTMMKGHDITDAASYEKAVKKPNSEFYDLRSKVVEDDNMIAEIEKRIKTLADYNKHKDVYIKWTKLPARKKDAFLEEHRAEITICEAAEKYLKGLKAGGEVVSSKKRKKELECCYKKKFFDEFEMQQMKERIHTYTIKAAR